MRVIIVAEHASSCFGGEAFIPLNFFRLLRARQVDAHLVVHARTADELRAAFPHDLARLHFTVDGRVQRALARLSLRLPRRVADTTTLFASHMCTQLAQRRLVRHLVKLYQIDVVHEPIPVSPKYPSLMWDVGAPVIIGPLNGGMEYPRSFRRQHGLVSRLAVPFSRRVADLLNIVMPGKRHARVVLVANQRTRDALPPGIKGTVIDLVENGVDFSIWQRTAISEQPNGIIRFVFVGRLVDWKAVDVLLEAVSRLQRELPLTLEIIGDGEMREQWENLTRRMGLAATVTFTGWMSQRECVQRLQRADVFVLPSLFECGGAVVLEAMAMGLPVIATAWGGPIDYLDESCGILVEPDSRNALIEGFYSGMKKMAMSSELRCRMGNAGYEKASRQFDWSKKADQILDIYARALDRSSYN